MAEQSSYDGEETKKSDFYQSWLLRIWKEHPDAPCRFQLKSVNSKDKSIFENLPELFDFLADEINSNT